MENDDEREIVMTETGWVWANPIPIEKPMIIHLEMELKYFIEFFKREEAK